MSPGPVVHPMAVSVVPKPPEESDLPLLQTTCSERSTDHRNMPALSPVDRIDAFGGGVVVNRTHTNCSWVASSACSDTLHQAEQDLARMRQNSKQKSASKERAGAGQETHKSNTGSSSQGRPKRLSEADTDRSSCSSGKSKRRVGWVRSLLGSSKPVERHRSNMSDRSSGREGDDFFASKGSEPVGIGKLRSLRSLFSTATGVNGPKAWKHSMSRMVVDGNDENVCFDDVMQAHKNDELAKWKSSTRYVLMPGSRNLAIWRLWMVLLVMFTIIMSPFELAFSWWKPPSSYKIIMRLIDVFCCVDMLLNFFVAGFKDGRIVVEFKHRVEGYLHSWFVPDLLTNFPWDLILSSSAGKSRKLAKVMKLPKVFRIFRLLRVAREEAYYFGVVFALAVIVVLAHYIACFWVWMLINCKESDSLAINDDSDLMCPSAIDAYALGLSVAVAALGGSDSWQRFIAGDRSFGAGVAAFDWRESAAAEIGASICCFVGFFSLAMLFGHISHSIERRDMNTRSFHERLSNLRTAANQNGIAPDLNRRVRKHYHYVWSCGSNAALEVLRDDALSADLRRQLALAFYGGSLRQVPFLENAEESFLKMLCDRVELECFSPQDYLVTAGEYCTDLYFLVTGSVRMENPETRDVLRTLVEGSFFGEMGLLLPESVRSVNVIADTAGWMLTVSRSDLQQICNDELLDSFRSVALERYQEEVESGVRQIGRTTTSDLVSPPIPAPLQQTPNGVASEVPPTNGCTTATGATVPTNGAAHISANSVVKNNVGPVNESEESGEKASEPQTPPAVVNNSRRPSTLLHTSVSSLSKSLAANLPSSLLQMRHEEEVGHTDSTNTTATTMTTCGKPYPQTLGRGNSYHSSNRGRRRGSDNIDMISTAVRAAVAPLSEQLSTLDQRLQRLEYNLDKFSGSVSNAAASSSIA